MRKWITIAVIALAVAAFGQQIQHGVICSWTWSGTGTPTFSVYRATVSGGEKSPIATGITTLSYTDTSAAINTKYFYTYTATVGGVESGPSSEVSAQITVPLSPTNPATSVF